MYLTVLGINHRTAPVEVRGKVAFPPDVVEQALAELLRLEGVHEAAILSTCNRTELYCTRDTPDTDELAAWLNGFHRLPVNSLQPHLYSYRDELAVRHVFRVAAGLDSMILGEPQILGQMKSCYQQALDSGSIETLINRLFQHTFSVAKQIRTDTAIGISPVSVAFAAVNLARQIFGDLTRQTALLIGAGETIELTARHLHERSLGNLIIANRTVRHAHELAAQFGGFGIGLDEIESHLGNVDIVIASTGSTTTMLGKETVEAALHNHKHRPMLMIDLAIPPDIDPAVAEFDDVYLYNLDDLQQVIEESRRSRQAAAEQAEDIIETQAARFMAWIRSLEAVPTLRAYREHAKVLGEAELERARRALESGAAADEIIAQLTRNLVRKLTHEPSVNMRTAVAEGETELLEAIKILFRLNDGNSD